MTWRLVASMALLALPGCQSGNSPPLDSTVAAYAPTEGVAGCVALTFDDGPGEYTPYFLETLGDYGMTATFFVVGQMLDDDAVAR